MKHAIGLLFLILPAIGCQKKSELKIIQWKTGDDPAVLAQLDNIEKSKEEVTAYYKNTSVHFSFQNFDGAPVSNTFIKKVEADGASIQRVHAGIYPQPKLELLHGFKKKLDVNSLRREMESLLPKATHSVTTDFEYAEENGVLRSHLLLDAELVDGSLWRGSFDDKAHLIELRQLGSRFANSIEAKVTVYDRGPRFGSLSEVLLKNILISPTVSNSQVLVTSESSQKITNIASTMKFDTKDERFDQLQAFFYITRVADWMKENLSVTLPNQLTAVVSVGFPEATNTAFYFQNKIRFGRGDDVTYSALTSDPSIVYHETFHAMIDAIAHLPFEKQGGSLNEAFADFFTCVALDRPFLGESSFLKGPFKRSLEVDYKLSEKNGGLYHDSQIVSGFLWSLKSEFGKVVSLKIAMETLIRLHPMSDFEDFNTIIASVAKQNLKTDQLAAFAEMMHKKGFQYE